jgi:hypothetical protein
MPSLTLCEEMRMRFFVGMPGFFFGFIAKNRTANPCEIQAEAA